MALLIALSMISNGCSDLNGDLFPNAPNNSFINTPALGPGPVAPPGPASTHTFANPTGR
jgi:hypothetical protein